MSRERLTITLKSDLVKKLDNFIDGQNIRNRSHAVEVLLARSLEQSKMKVLILSGGRTVKVGKTEIPKGLVRVQGDTLIGRTLSRLAALGFGQVIISTGDLGSMIKKEFGDGSTYGLDVLYIEQKKETKGTAQAIKEALHLFNNEPFMVLYSDVLSDLNLNDLSAFHTSMSGALASMALTSVDQVSEWGVAKLNGSRVINFEEKPKKPSTKSHLVNAGMYVLSPEIKKYLTEDSVRLESDVLPRLAEEGKLFGYPFDGEWQDIAAGSF